MILNYLIYVLSFGVDLKRTSIYLFINNTGVYIFLSFFVIVITRIIITLLQK
jgi:hypothetical protein